MTTRSAKGNVVEKLVRRTSFFEHVVFLCVSTAEAFTHTGR